MKRLPFKKPTVKVPKVSIKKHINHWNFKKITQWMFSFAIVIALITSWFWYSRLYMTNERRFWMAIDNSMATPSVVRTLVEGGTGNQVVQSYRFHYAPQQAIQNQVVFTQKSATLDTQVITEGIIFPQDQYLRYTKFVNRSNEKELANINHLLGVWAEQNSEDEEEAKMNYLSEYVSLVVFGNFSPEKRQEFVNRLQEIYEVDFASSISETVNEENVLQYSVTVNLREYVVLLNDTFIAAGYGELASLDPDNYKEDGTITARISVRTRDNAVVGVSFGGRDEAYSNYGVLLGVEAPEPEFGIEELQNKVQEALQ